MGIPYAFYHAGIPVGLILNLFGASVTLYGSYLYLKAKDFSGLESLSEIGYILLGRKSIFILNIIITLSVLGLTIIYFIIFGDITSSLIRENFDNKNSFLCKRPLYVLAIALLVLPLILKREVAHLKIASYILFLGIILFIVMFIIQLFV